MTLNQVSIGFDSQKNGKELDELGYLIYHCWDLPLLQTSRLAQLPPVLKRAEEERHGLELAKALRKELIACAEEITQRPRFPIEDIINAIEKENMTHDGQELEKIRKAIGVPFPRNKLDLARYYTIRLVMQGIDQPTIAEFLEVDLRTVANYVAQAKKRIHLILETKTIPV